MELWGGVHRSPSPPETVIVVPCYNEAQRLPTESFVTFLSDDTRNIRLIFVDDGSDDETLGILSALQHRCPHRIGILRLPENCGKAEATRLGIQYAMQSQCEFVGFLDADLATPLSEMSSMIQLMRQNRSTSLVMGARVSLLGRKIHRSIARHYIGRFAATLISFLLRLPVYDSQCGAKVFRCDDAAKHVFHAAFLSKWLFDVEILRRYCICLAGASQTASDAIVEFPLHEWRDVKGSKLRIRHFATAFFDLMRIFLSRWSVGQHGLGTEGQPS